MKRMTDAVILFVFEEGSILLKDSVPLRSTPAPPTIYCVICSANNLYLAGPSPCPCPGVDTP